MSSPTPIGSVVTKTVNWSIALSILLILAGLIAIFIPSLSGIAITLVIGWLMVFSGFTHLILAFKTHTTGSLLWELLVGLVYVLAGFYLISHPLAGLLSLTLILAIYLFMEGIFEIILAIQVTPRHGVGWLWFNAIVTLILAVMIWRAWPFSSGWVIGTLVGISMLFSGMSRLMISLAARRAIHRIA